MEKILGVGQHTKVTKLPRHQDMIFKFQISKVHLYWGESHSIMGKGKHLKSFSQPTALCIQPLRTVNLYIVPV